MVKSFKLQRHFHSPCRSWNVPKTPKDPPTLPQDPVPAFPQISPANRNFTSINLPAFKDQTIYHSSFMPVVEDSTQKFKWKEEEKWHVFTKITPRWKIYSSSASGGSDGDDGFTFAVPRNVAPPSSGVLERRLLLLRYSDDCYCCCI